MKAVPYACTGARPDPERVSVHRVGWGAAAPGLPDPDFHPAGAGFGPAAVRLHDLRDGAASLALAGGVAVRLSREIP
jgi:hypothetical protein